MVYGIGETRDARDKLKNYLYTSSSFDLYQ